VSKVQFSANGNLIAALSHDWQAAVWDLRSGRALRLFDVPSGLSADNAALALSDDGQRFAFCAGNHAKLWDLASGKELGSWDLPTGIADVMAFHPSGKLLLFRWEKRVYLVRDLLGAQPLQPFAQLHGFERQIFDAASSPDGRYIIAEGYGGPHGADLRIKAFESLTGRELWSVDPKRPDSKSGRVYVDPTGTVVSGELAHDDTARLYRMPGGEFIRDLPWKPGCIGPGGQMWATTMAVAPKRQPGVSLLRHQDKLPLIVLGIDRRISSIVMQFDREGRRVAWGNADGTVSVCDLEEIRNRLAGLGL
jgi:WD40 repeat protein